MPKIFVLEENRERTVRKFSYFSELHRNYLITIGLVTYLLITIAEY